jgi:hypothetical protein
MPAAVKKTEENVSARHSKFPEPSCQNTDVAALNDAVKIQLEFTCLKEDNDPTCDNGFTAVPI